MSCSVDFTPACYSRCTIFQSCFTLCWVNSITSPIILLKKVMILHHWIQNAWLSKLSHKKGKKKFNFPRIFSYKLLIIFTLTPFYISSKNILQMTVLLCIQHVCHVRCGHVCMLKKSHSHLKWQTFGLVLPLLASSVNWWKCHTSHIKSF